MYWIEKDLSTEKNIFMKNIEYVDIKIENIEKWGLEREIK